MIEIVNDYAYVYANGDSIEDAIECEIRNAGNKKVAALYTSNINNVLEITGAKLHLYDNDGCDFGEYSNTPEMVQRINQEKGINLICVQEDGNETKFFKEHIIPLMRDYTNKAEDVSDLEDYTSDLNRLQRQYEGAMMRVSDKCWIVYDKDNPAKSDYFDENVMIDFMDEYFVGIEL